MYDYRKKPLKYTLNVWLETMTCARTKSFRTFSYWHCCLAASPVYSGLVSTSDNPASGLHWWSWRDNTWEKRSAAVLLIRIAPCHIKEKLSSAGTCASLQLKVIAHKQGGVLCCQKMETRPWCFNKVKPANLQVKESTVHFMHGMDTNFIFNARQVL